MLKIFLIPSERVWRSIYNDLHPGSKCLHFCRLIMFLTLFWWVIQTESIQTKDCLTGKKYSMGTENKGDPSFVVPYEKERHGHPLFKTFRGTAIL